MESIGSLLFSVVFACVTIAFVWLVIFCIKVKRLEKSLSGLQGEPKHWLLGNLNNFPGLNESFVKRDISLMATYPTHRKFWKGPSEVEILLYHPEVLQDILRGSEPKPTYGGAYMTGLPWIGDGLLLSSGPKWARNRRLLTPAFHFDILKSYVKIKNSVVGPLLKRFETAATRKEPVETFHALSLYTFDVLVRCTMGYEEDIQREGDAHPYVQAVKNLTELWAERLFNPLLNHDFIYRLTSSGRKFFRLCDYVHSISERMIRNRMEALQASESSHDDGTKKQAKVTDFLTILIQARDDEGKGLTFREIRNEVDTFLFEGHDTTTSGISWILYALACNPEHQRACQQEIDSILHGRDSDDILWDDLGQLKYLTLCIKEAMRVYPPVPAVQRQLTKPLTVEGVTLEKDTVITVCLGNLHRNPLVWPEPDKFDPERFLPENFDKLDNFSYVPFSAGPRNCIGQNFAMNEMKITLAHILRRFTVSPDPAHPALRRPDLVLKAENGVYLLVTARSE